MSDNAHIGHHLEREIRCGEQKRYGGRYFEESYECEGSALALDEPVALSLISLGCPPAGYKSILVPPPYSSAYSQFDSSSWYVTASHNTPQCPAPLCPPHGLLQASLPCTTMAERC